MTYKLEQLLSNTTAIADGAMGTMLYEKGVFVNTCFDELNLTRPQFVHDVHKQYIEAGADFIQTNTFGANELKLGRFGLADKTNQINSAAAQIARQAAGQQTLVAGSIGPLGLDYTPHNPQHQLQCDTAFKNQAAYLIEAGVDFLILETFSNSAELIAAINAIRQITDIEIVAQLTVNERNETAYGETIDSAIEKLNALSITALGMNCSVGPAQMLTGLERIRTITDKPIAVQPNAGFPREIDNRMIYMATPEYMAEYAKRFYEKGAKIIGGCCGTTPDHIREIAKAVRSVAKADKAGYRSPQIEISTVAQISEKLASRMPLEMRSKLGSKLANNEKIFMIELTPPRGTDLKSTLEKARICAEHGIDAINIPDGPRASSRLSPMVTACQIQQHAGIETVLHFCCRDRNLIGMQSDLLGASALGIHNMLVVTGDPPKLGNYPTATGVFDMDSIALTGVLHNLNAGIDIGANTFEPPTTFTIGVGANPVATDLEREIEKFRQKVIAGAEYAITQPIFDPKMLFEFLDAIKEFQIPIIAGIWPFTSYKNAEFMANEVPGVVVPQQLLNRMLNTDTAENARAEGINIAREMLATIKDRVAGFAISAPFGNVKTALAVLES